jgi:D-beta-D-heptose 7-phosphate kinase/D-beta-D-heptose 1-phosphate adenosyltransferase
MNTFTSAIESKIITREDLHTKLAQWRAAGKRIVFTNGCFDILHEGHLRYLCDARALGDILVIGLNSDASVRRLKGPERPINQETSRSLMLAGLLPVDGVILFEEDTPLNLIEALAPDVLVKGGDWSVDQIVGAEGVIARGGEVYSLPFHDGFSTTGMVNKIRLG